MPLTMKTLRHRGQTRAMLLSDFATASFGTRDGITDEGNTADQLQFAVEGEPMGNLSGVVEDLKKELKRAQHDVERFTAALAALGISGSNGRRTLSASARKRISRAQKARWAKARNGSKPAAAKTTGSAPAKRTMSASARRKIAAAQRKRWAKLKAGNKK
jgi:hypothetical protein